MIRIKRKRNPNLEGEEFIDNKFLDLLFESVVYNHPLLFSQALVYKNIGLNKCVDCSTEAEDHYYDDCDCENYLEDYNIQNRNWSTSENLIIAIEKQFKYLSLSQLIRFRTKLINLDYGKNDIIRIGQEDAEDLIKYINNVISKRK